MSTRAPKLFSGIILQATLYSWGLLKWSRDHSRPIRGHNQIIMSRSLDHSQPFRDQYPGKGEVITLDQSEDGILDIWSLLTNQRLASRSRDYSRPMRGQYPGQMCPFYQSEASILVTWSLLTNQRPVSWFHLVFWRGLKWSQALDGEVGLIPHLQRVIKTNETPSPDELFYLSWLTMTSGVDIPDIWYDTGQGEILLFW